MSTQIENVLHSLFACLAFCTFMFFGGTCAKSCNNNDHRLHVIEEQNEHALAVACTRNGGIWHNYACIPACVRAESVP